MFVSVSGTNCASTLVQPRGFFLLSGWLHNRNWPLPLWIPGGDSLPVISTIPLNRLSRVYPHGVLPSPQLFQGFMQPNFIWSFKLWYYYFQVKKRRQKNRNAKGVNHAKIFIYFVKVITFYCLSAYIFNLASKEATSSRLASWVMACSRLPCRGLVQLLKLIMSQLQVPCQLYFSLLTRFTLLTRVFSLAVLTCCSGSSRANIACALAIVGFSVQFLWS